jgi:hypothetical protein
MDEDRLQKIKIGQLLDVIRERPAMYLGKRSLTALSHFLDMDLLSMFTKFLHHTIGQQTSMTGWLIASILSSPPVDTPT